MVQDLLTFNFYNKMYHINAVSEEAPIRAEWVIDGMAAVQSVCKDYMWGIWRLVLYCMPRKMLNPEK